MTVMIMVHAKSPTNVIVKVAGEDYNVSTKNVLKVLAQDSIEKLNRTIFLIVYQK